MINFPTNNQTPDPRPGPYYVSAIDAGKTHIMAGPFERHSEALDSVKKASDLAYNIDARAWFMSWGTVRIEGCERIGQLNKFGLWNH